MRRVAGSSLVLVALALALVAGGCGGSGTSAASAPGSTSPRAARASAVRPVAARAAPIIVHGPHRTPVPILMYHAIASPPPDVPYPELYVAPAAFRAQMAWLARSGYHAVTLRHAYDYWMRGVALPRKPIVLSFDDGYPGDVDVALPALRGRGWAGVLNFHIGNLIPARVRALIRGGWEVDSHTISHVDLTTLDPRRLRREVAGSRAWIRGVFHVPAAFFCYPSGRYDDAVVAEVRRAGYLAATTTDPGFASPRDGLWTLRRVRVNGSDGVAGLAAKLRSGA